MTVVLDRGARVPWRGVLRRTTACSRRSVPEPASSQGPAPTGSRRYRLEVDVRRRQTVTVDDPYRFWPTLGDVDLHLIGEGTPRALWRHLGAHVREHEGVAGTAFAVWAPNARGGAGRRRLQRAGTGALHPMRMLGSSGVWELFVPGVAAGARYKFEVVTADGHAAAQGRPVRRRGRAPARHGQRRRRRRATSGATTSGWPRARRADPLQRPLSIYEVHLGSWRRRSGLDYRELADAAARLRRRPRLHPRRAPARRRAPLRPARGATR